MKTYKKILWSGSIARNDLAVRLAKSFGYIQSNELGSSNLEFNPNSKTIVKTFYISHFDKDQYFLANTIEDLYKSFLSPIPIRNVLTSKNKAITAEVLETDAGVMITDSSVNVQIFVPQDLINKLFKTRDQALPLVCFMYPDSNASWHRLVRYVRVIRLDDEKLCGLELARGTRDYDPQAEGVFKKYELNKIEGLSFIEFIQNPKS